MAERLAPHLDVHADGRVDEGTRFAAGRGPEAASGRHGRLAGSTAAAFAVLFAAALAMVHRSPGLGDSDAAIRAFYLGNSDALIVAASYLVPFAGIAFLWHLTTLRSFLEARSPAAAGSIPYGLQVLSGLVFVALLFAGAAAAAAVALLKELTDAPLPSADVARGLLGLGYGLVFVYAVRGAGMYAIATTTLLHRAGVLPRWLALAGYLLAAFLLVSTTLNPVVVLVFPAWSLVVGVVLFVRAGRPPATPVIQRGAHP